MNVYSNCFNLYISRSFLSLQFMSFFIYSPIPPLMHSFAEDLEFYQSISTEALFSIDLVSLTPKQSDGKLCSEIRAVNYMFFYAKKKVKKYSNRKNIDSSSNYSLNKKSHMAQNTC